MTVRSEFPGPQGPAGPQVLRDVCMHIAARNPLVVQHAFADREPGEEHDEEDQPEDHEQRSERDREGWPFSTCALAFSESWTEGR